MVREITAKRIMEWRRTAVSATDRTEIR